MEFKRTNTNRQRKGAETVTPQDSSSVTPKEPSRDQSTPKTVNISINFGKPSWLRLPSSAKIRALARNKWVILSVAAIVAVSISGVTHYFLTREKPAQPAAAPLDKLEYQTVVPKDKSIQQLGGWQRVSPPNATPVFAYGDTIDGVKISVSQQPTHS